MASNTTNLQLVLDNRVNVGKHSTAMVKISGSNVNDFYVNADGSAWPSQITFNNVVVPSLSNTVISRNARIQYVVTIVVNQDPTGTKIPYLTNPTLAANIAQPPNACLRAFPLNSVCDTIQGTFNGQTVTINSRQVISALQRRIGKDYLKAQATECPCQPDNIAQLYPDNTSNLSQSNQPLSSYNNSDGTTRASFMPISAVKSGTSPNFIWTYKYLVSEPVCLPPFSLHDEEVYFSNINTMSLVFNYSSLNDMLVYAATDATGATALNSVNSITITSPKLQLKYIQVNSDIVQIPRLTSLPFEVVNYFAKSMSATLTATSGTQLQSDNLRLQSLPSLMYIFARIPMSSRTGATGANAYTDTFAGVGNLSSGQADITINIGTRTGLLASATVESLYRMSKRNGLNCSFNEWLYGGNGVIILDPVEDLGVDVNNGDVLPGESGNVNFQVSCTFNGAPWAYAGATLPTSLELMVVPVYSGIMTFTPDNAVANIGELNQREIDALLKTAPKEGSMVSSEVFQPTIKGAGFFSKFKSILGSAAGSDLGKKLIGEAAKRGAEFGVKKLTGGAFTSA